MARLTRSRWKEIVATVVALLLVLPPTVLGFYLLLALGPAGLGGWLGPFFGLHLRLHPSGPGCRLGDRLAARGATGAYLQPWEAAAEVAATLRASRPVRIRGAAGNAGDLAGPLVFAHTVGEFGVILMIGGNIPGETALSIAIYDLVETRAGARRISCRSACWPSPSW